MKTKIFAVSLSFLLAISTWALNAQSMTKFEPTIREVKEIKMVYYSFTGPYMECFNDYNSLITHIQTTKIPMGQYSVGVYYDDPQVVPENELRSEVGFMTTDVVKETDKYKFKTIPAGKAVSVKYKSMEDIYRAYEALARYIKENELKTEEFSIEIYYSSDPNVVDTEILMMIKE